jgi:hypothetical protein
MNAGWTLLSVSYVLSHLISSCPFPFSALHIVFKHVTKQPILSHRLSGDTSKLVRRISLPCSQRGCESLDVGTPEVAAGHAGAPSLTFLFVYLR